jgi:hypothetical protein
LWSHPPKPQPITMLHHHPQTTQHINRLPSPSRFFGKLRLIFDRVIWIIYGNYWLYMYLHWPPDIIIRNTMNIATQMADWPLLQIERRPGCALSMEGCVLAE